MIVELWALYLLAVTDGLIAGYRDSLGRNPLHHKGKYFARGCLRGVVLVHAVLGCAAVLGVACYLIAPELGTSQAALSETVSRFAGRLARVYVVYASMIALGLFAYIVPMFEVRSYITIGLFGVLTMLRPVAIALGVGLAAAHVYGEPGWGLVTALAALVGLAMSQLDRVHRLVGWNAFDWDELMQS